MNLWQRFQWWFLVDSTPRITFTFDGKTIYRGWRWHLGRSEYYYFFEGRFGWPEEFEILSEVIETEFGTMTVKDTLDAYQDWKYR